MQIYSENKPHQKNNFYQELSLMLKSLLSVEKDWIANLSNTTALLNEYIDDLNWVGFYLFKKGELIVGPFQGKIACTRISLGSGVCGAAAQKLKTIRVQNVHEFPNHIVCDKASNSEIVLPLFRPNHIKSLENLIGVLDLDSPKKGRFLESDEEELEKIIEIISYNIIWPESLNEKSLL